MRVTKRQAISASALALFVAIVATVVTVRILDRSGRDSSGSTSISAKGGQLTVGNVTVTVPEGAVVDKTRLSISLPRTAALQPPLARLAATPSVAFDVSLGDHQQPRKPLRLQVRLQGRYLPAGANPRKTLLYTLGPAGYELIPADVSATNLLSAQLNHLSPKFLTWIDPRKWIAGALNQVFPNGTFKNRPADCAKRATYGGVTVHFDDQQAGWSSGRTSAAHPCLSFKQGQVSLLVTNNSNIMWPVGTSDSSKISAPASDLDTVYIGRLARLIGLPKGAKAILGRSNNLTVTTATQNLPLIVKMTVTPATQQAEALLTAVYMLIDILGLPDSSKILKTLLDSKSVTECIQSSANLFTNGNLASDINDAFSILTSKCGEKVLGIIAKQTGNSALGWFAHKALSVVGNIKTLAENVITGLESIPRQFASVTISVNQVVPCPSGSELAQLIRRLDHNGPSDPQLGTHGGPANVYKDVISITVAEQRCAGNWLATHIVTGFNTAPGASTDDLVVLHWASNHWELYVNAGTDYSGLYPCKPPVPAAIQQFMTCQ